MTEAKYEGEILKLGGQNYTVPPLSFKQLKKIWPRILEAQTNSDGLKLLELTVEVVYAALSRNYPEISVDQVEDMIDLKNVQSIFETVLGASGFVRGEAQAGNVPSGT